jgi:serine/threonine protein kinase
MDGGELGHFSLLEKIGEGGMGRVYKARDRRLERFVAIKLLAEGRLTDPDRRARFIQEAKAASALNHPNIITIHEIGEHDGRTFIVMELVDGKPLNELIPRKGMRLTDALRIAAQVADALTAAHAAGIVHRDLKPGNLMVDAHGRAKVLDFGLAKLSTPAAVGEDSATHTLALEQPVTEEGVILGSIPYMSPEQAEGKPVDARSDIFSFGTVLYEMITGQRAFQGESRASTLAAVVEKDPQPPSEISSTTPPELDRLIARCLRKDVKRRSQNMADVKLALEELRDESESGKLARPVAAKSRGRSWIVGGALLAVAAVLGSALLLILRRPSNTTLDLVPVRITSNGTDLPVESIALSPDGKYLAYSDAKGVHVRSLQGGETRLLPNTTGMLVGDWTADATRVLIANGRLGITDHWYSISVLGDSPRSLGDWQPSPDGRYSLRNRDSALDIRSATGVAYSIPLDKHDWGFGLSWSPGTKSLAVVSRTSGKSWIEGIQLDNGRKSTLLPPQPNIIYDVVWLSPSELMYSLSERSTFGGNGNLWTLRLDAATGLPSAPPRPRTHWADFSVQWLSVTADGKRVCLVREKTQRNVWLGDLDSGGTRLTGLRQLTVDDAQEVPYAWTRDSKSVLFRSDRDGHERIYKQDTDKNVAELMTPDSANPRRARVSPDGQWLLYETAGPIFSLSRMPIDGGDSQTVLSQDKVFSLQCSSRPGAPCLLRHGPVSLFDPIKGVTTGVVKTLPEDASAAISPDGQHIACLVKSISGNPGNQIRIANLQGDTERLVTVAGAGSLGFLEWDASGTGFLTSDLQPSTSRVLHIRLDGTAYVLMEEPGHAAPWAIASPNGRQIATFKSASSSNVWMVENP